MPWGNTFREAVLNHLFRGATSPRQDALHLRLRTVDGELVNPAVWTNYAPLEIDTSAATSVFEAAADPGDGSREVATDAQITFQESPELDTVTELAIRHVELATAASGGDVVMREQLAFDVIVQPGMPVRIPAGELAALFTGAGI